MLRPDSVTAQFMKWAMTCPVHVLGRCISAQFMKWASDSLELKLKKKDINFYEKPTRLIKPPCLHKQ